MKRGMPAVALLAAVSGAADRIGTLQLEYPLR